MNKQVQNAQRIVHNVFFQLAGRDKVKFEEMAKSYAHHFETETMTPELNAVVLAAKDIAKSRGYKY